MERLVRLLSGIEAGIAFLRTGEPDHVSECFVDAAAAIVRAVREGNRPVFVLESAADLLAVVSGYGDYDRAAVAHALAEALRAIVNEETQNAVLLDEEEFDEPPF